jgi:hypothetical protein
MIKPLQSTWLAAAAGALLFLATTFLLLPAERLTPSKPAAAEEIDPMTRNSWDYRSPEVDQLINELKKEKEALALRELQLNELSMRLQSERSEINQITQQVHQLQIEFDQTILRVREGRPPISKSSPRSIPR